MAFARLAWFALVATLVGILASSIPTYYQWLISLDIEVILYGPWNPQNLGKALADLGLTPAYLAIYRIILDTIQVLAFFTIGGLIFWKKSDTLLGLFASFVLIGLGTTVGSGFIVLENFPSPWRELLTFIGGLVWPALFIFFFLFPDGQFVPHWTRWFIPLWAAFYLWYAVSYLILKLEIDIFLPWGNIFLILSLGTSLISQIFRYLRVSGPIERLQTKWFLLALIFLLFWVAFQNLFLEPFLQTTRLPKAQVLLLDLLWQFSTLASNLTLPLSIAIALFRYRLWDIDVIIRRTLIYGALTAALALVYAGSVVLLQQVFQVLTGIQGQSQPAIVISTLVVAALFSPLRKRLQERIDQRFYRKRYNAERVLADFAVQARQETDLEALTAQLLGVVQNSLQPESVSLWLEGTTHARRI